MRWGGRSLASISPFKITTGGLCIDKCSCACSKQLSEAIIKEAIFAQTDPNSIKDDIFIPLFGSSGSICLKDEKLCSPVGWLPLLYIFLPCPWLVELPTVHEYMKSWIFTTISLAFSSWLWIRSLANLRWCSVLADVGKASIFLWSRGWGNSDDQLRHFDDRWSACYAKENGIMNGKY